MIVGSVGRPVDAAARIALSWTGGGLEDDWPGILVAVVAVLDAACLGVQAFAAVASEAVVVGVQVVVGGDCIQVVVAVVVVMGTMQRQPPAAVVVGIPVL